MADVMPDDISPQKNVMNGRLAGAAETRYDKRWQEGYKAGTINAPLPRRCTIGYRAGYAEGLIELQRLMNLDDDSDEVVLLREPTVVRPMSDVGRQAEPPPDLDRFESSVMAPNANFMIGVDRTFLRELLCYLRRLESEVAEMGSFW